MTRQRIKKMNDLRSNVRDSFRRFDEAAFALVNRSRRPGLVHVMRLLCRFFDTDAAGLVSVSSIVAGGTLAQFGQRAGLAMLFTGLVVAAIKNTVRRQRPATEFQALLPPDHFSFPSGHTAAAFAMAATTWVSSCWLGIGLTASAFCVGIARVYLGVHYPLDALIGAVTGTVVGVVIVCAL